MAFNLKDREYYLEVVKQVHPAAKISSLIDEHSYTGAIDEETGAFEYVLKEDNMLVCDKADCAICKEISYLKELSADYSLGTAAKRSIDKLLVGHFGKVFQMGLSLNQFAKLMGVTVDKLRGRVDELIEDEGMANVVSILKLYELTDEAVAGFLQISGRQLRKYKSYGKKAYEMGGEF